MGTQKDYKIGQAALAKGWISTAQLAQCFQMQQQENQSGRYLPMVEILEKSYLNSSQIADLENQVSSDSAIEKISKASGDSQGISTFGRYKIIEVLGQGGMGKVYKAYDPSLQREIALKVLLGQDSSTDVNRFLREAQAIAKLAHPNIVSIYDTGNQQGQYFFTMDYIQGKTLDSFKSMPLDFIVKIMKDVGNAIHYAHRIGIIHRDLKPGNIIVNDKKQPLVMDFGLVKMKGSNRLSQSGAVLGTIQYMPPEQAQGSFDLIDERTDVYSLGVILYEMITGKLPFEGTSVAQVMVGIMEAQPLPPTKINVKISKDLESICLKALHKKQEHRYQSAAAFASDLQRFTLGETVEARSLNKWQKMGYKLKKYKKAMIAFLLLFLCAIGTIVAIWEMDKNKKKTLAKALKLEALGIFAKTPKAKTLENVPFSPRLLQKLDKTLQKCLKARILLEQAFTLEPDSKSLRQYLFQVEKEIGLLGLLGRNYILSQIAFSRCLTLVGEKARPLLDLVAAKKQELKQKRLNRIKKIMDSLVQIPKQGMVEEYTTEIVRMQAPYVLKRLVFYLSSANKWQRYTAIEAIGQFGTYKISIANKSVASHLIDHLKKLNPKYAPQEAETTIWALGRLKVDRAISLVEKMRWQTGHESSFWYKTKLPCMWLGLKDVPKKDISSKKSNNFKKIYRRASRKLEHGDLQGAMQDCETALKINPNFAFVYVIRGGIYVKQGFLEKAIADFSKAIALDKKSAPAFYNRAVVWRRMGETKKALLDLNKAIDLKPNYINAYHSRGNSYRDLKKFDLALIDYTKVLEINPHFIKSYLSRAYLYKQKKNIPGAIADYDKVLELEPTYTRGYNNRGILYLKIDIKKAIADFSRAIDLKPNYPDPYRNRGIAYMRTQQIPLAVSDFKTFLKLNPNSPQADRLRNFIQKHQKR